MITINCVCAITCLEQQKNRNIGKEITNVPVQKIQISLKDE